jgi:hypothetical protein
MRSLASNNRMTRVVLPGIGLATIVVVIMGVAATASPRVITIVVLLLAFLAVLLIALLLDGTQSYDLYYDDMNLYLNRRGNRIVVPFRAITRVKKDEGSMRAGGKQVYQFTIYYRDSNDQSQEVDFWKSLEDGSAEDFQRKVERFKTH